MTSKFVRIVLVATLLLVWFQTDASAQFRKRVVMYSGMSAPGTIGATFSSTSSPTTIGISDDETVFFFAHLEGGDTQVGVNDFGLWVERNESLFLLARLGSAAPGFSGFTFGEFLNTYIDSDGNIAFVANVYLGTVFFWNQCELF